MDESAPYSIDEALAFGLADRLHERHGLVLHLYGPQSGLWLAEFSRPGRWDGHLGDGYMRAPTRAQAIRLAAEQALGALGDETGSSYPC